MVAVKCSGLGSGEEVWRSVVVVDEPITGLELEGPTVVEIERYEHNQVLLDLDCFDQKSLVRDI